MRCTREILQFKNAHIQQSYTRRGRESTSHVGVRLAYWFSSFRSCLPYIECGGQLSTRSESSTALVIFRFLHCIFWMAGNRRSEPEVRQSWQGGREAWTWAFSRRLRQHGAHRGVVMLRTTDVAQRVSGWETRRSGRFTKRWWRQHLRRQRSCRQGRRWHPRQRRQRSRQHRHQRRRQKRHRPARLQHRHPLRHQKHRLRR